MSQYPRDRRRVYQAEYRRKRVAAMRAVLGGACRDCGTTEGLEFHHPDRKEKKASIGALLDSPSGVLEEEAKKCVLLCRLCHNEITMIELGWPPREHGTRWMYRSQGCRCGPCRDFVNNEQKKWRRKRLGKSPSGHGNAL
jgi:hypothetical protein